MKQIFFMLNGHSICMTIRVNIFLFDVLLITFDIYITRQGENETTINS